MRDIRSQPPYGKENKVHNNELTTRDVAEYLTECSEREFAEVFTYFYESNYYFETHPNARVKDKDILKISAYECGKCVQDTIIYGMMEIEKERGERRC